MRLRSLITIAWCLVCLCSIAQTGKNTLHLFDEAVKQSSPPYVCDFLEHYLYEVSQSPKGYDFYQRLADDKVVIRDGSLTNITRLSPKIPFAITRYEDKGYNVCWTDTLGRVLLDMQFPLQFELLLGQTKAEMEKTLKSELEGMRSIFLVQPADASLKERSDGIFQSESSSFYYVESLTTASYYRRKGSGMEPVYSSDRKSESAANLFLGLIDNIGSYRLHIEQMLYGFKSSTYNIGLTQWLNYCRANQLKVYFGIEQERTDGLKALLIARNQDLGYNHVLSIIIPDNFVEKRNAVLKVVLNAYVPTDNVKDLYKDDIIKGVKDE